MAFPRAAGLRLTSRRLLAGACLITLLALRPMPALAQGPPINTQNAFVTGLSGGAFRTFFFSFDRSGLLLDGTKVDDPLDRQVHVRGQAFVLPYELVANRLVVMAIAPYLDKTLELGPPQNRRRLSTSGFGDLAIAAKLGIYQNDGPSRTTRVALFGRLKLPTATDDAAGSGDQPLPRSLQLGTGSVDYSAGIWASPDISDTLAAHNGLGGDEWDHDDISVASSSLKQ